MFEDKKRFIEGCIQGFNDANSESQEWMELTKAERVKLAERALIDFEKIYYGFECVDNFKKSLV